MRSDIALHATVRTTLQGVLGPASSRVAVIVRDGVVTLGGEVDAPDDRITAGCAVLRIADVRALADGIRVSGGRNPRQEVRQCPTPAGYAASHPGITSLREG